MSDERSRREVLGTAARGAALVGLAGLTGVLAVKANKTYAWSIDITKCVNSKLGALGVDVCEACATDCVLTLSAVRAVNEFSECGRCYICPAYYDITSAVGPDGLPSEKLCPRDAIEREAIGWIDPDDPANNFYEYTIDEKLCNGCGRCVMECKEPAGLGSIRLEVRHNVCLDCNRCSIATACPEEAYERDALSTV
ncbi:MAG: ferredoxin [Acidobacteria bacterium]|nr:ferredoxin [Acidobacteriota bacterium]NIM63455.1 ferredoxin [Acidobacteriota bacterium]NIO60883.1 ferredoxin [Acidobacteriota bacterium]NIQ31075.1 ferredoxin [Acidobacteriota bacterium]NIQ87344.1 ferredoxin [Acidobacteriota bacterium]